MRNVSRYILEHVCRKPGRDNCIHALRNDPIAVKMCLLMVVIVFRKGRIIYRVDGGPFKDIK
jgi:hypothetical protein